MAKSLQLFLDHSWPLWELSQHVELGHVLNSVITDGLAPGNVGALGPHHAGLWECDLADNNKLTWSGGIYDIFGVPRGSPIKRDEAVTFYSESSRAAMERLRRYAIQHKRGFTLDVEIYAAGVGNSRNVRLIAAPVCDEGGRPVRLHGVKLPLQLSGGALLKDVEDLRIDISSATSPQVGDIFLQNRIAGARGTEPSFYLDDDALVVRGVMTPAGKARFVSELPRD